MYTAMPIDLPFRVAVIGVRDTGARIAAWLALRGFPVAVYDTSLDAATATRQVTDVLVASATYTEAIAVEARRRVLVVTDSLAAALHGASWVIDCAQEPLAVKLGTLAAIGGAMPVGCLLTTPAYWCSLTELRFVHARSGSAVPLGHVAPLTRFVCGRWRGGVP